jgi:RNA polymerase sigma factor (sigma-70 family)
VSALLGRTVSDEHLGRRLADGEASAFDELYRRYAHRLAAYGTHLLGDAAAGDDVAQVALMRAYQALREGRVPDAIGAWLYRVAHNAAIDTVRHRRELPTEFLPERGDEPAAGEPGALTAAIAALPERQQKVFVLRELHGLRIAEAASELGLSNAQVEQALFAARNRLAEQLVFGERLSCAAVQRLAVGPLDRRERRALKTHVRSCPSCRKQLGLRGVALSLLPLPSLGWGRGAPAAGKLVALAATGAVGVTIPLVALHPHPAVALTRPVITTGPDVPLSFGGARAGALSIVRAVPRQPTRTAHPPRRRRVTFRAPTRVVVAAAPAPLTRTTHAVAPRAPAPSAPIATVAAVPIITDSSGRDGGGSHDGSGDMRGDSSGSGDGNVTDTTGTDGG